MISFVVFDFDGVFSDGKFYFNNGSMLSKCYSSKDVFSLKMLKNKNIKTGIITNDNLLSLNNAQIMNERIDKYYDKGDKCKLDVLNDWIKELGITYNEVAYIGDDLPDIPILNKVKLSACPNDAVPEVKSICNYICTKNGGNGAVREFVEHILNYNNINVCFCIPARYESTRLKNKLLLNINAQSCIQRTVHQVSLSKYNNGNNIFIFTDSEIIKNNLSPLSCNIILTDNEYKNGSERISKNLNKIDEKYNIIVNVQADEPYISPLNIDHCIDIHLKNLNQNVFLTTLHETNNSDGFLQSSASLKVVLNNNDEVLYYSRNLIPSNKNHIINNITYNTFTGIYVYNKDKLLQYGNLENSFLQTEEDCEQLKVLENNYIIKSYPTIEYNEISLNTKEDYTYLIQKYETMQLQKTYTLDCTLRDGGYINNWRFTEEFIKEYISLMEECNIDMVEIGFVNIPQTYKNQPTGVTRHITEEYIEQFIGHSFKICALCDYGNINYELLQKNIKLDIIRVAFHKKDLNEALNECFKIKKLGYKVSVNAMAITNYTNDELLELIKIVNKFDLDILYIADSFGSLNQNELINYLNIFNTNLINTSIGIHLHNNMNNAFNNFVFSKTVSLKNNFYIDCTLYGMGRGAGNLQTELVLNHNSITNEQLFSMLIFINKNIKKHFNSSLNNWGYDLDFFLAGVLKIHPNYINKFREMNLSFENSLNLCKELINNNNHNYFKLDIINDLVGKYNNLLL